MKVSAILGLCLLATPAAHAAALDCKSPAGPGDFAFRFTSDPLKPGAFLHEDFIEKKTGRVARTNRKITLANREKPGFLIRTAPKKVNDLLTYVEIGPNPTDTGSSAMATWYFYESDYLGLTWDWYAREITFLDCVLK